MGSYDATPGQAQRKNKNLFISVLVPENFTEYVHGVHVFLVHWVTVPK